MYLFCLRLHRFAAKSHLDIHLYTHRHPKTRNGKKGKNNKPKATKVKPKEAIKKLEESLINPQHEPVSNVTEGTDHVQLEQGNFLASDNLPNPIMSSNILVHELNKLHPETILIQIPEAAYADQEQMDLTNQIPQPLDEPGVSFQCNAEGIVEFCTFSI